VRARACVCACDARVRVSARDARVQVSMSVQVRTFKCACMRMRACARTCVHARACVTHACVHAGGWMTGEGRVWARQGRRRNCHVVRALGEQYEAFRCAHDERHALAVGGELVNPQNFKPGRREPALLARLPVPLAHLSGQSLPSTLGASACVACGSTRALPSSPVAMCAWDLWQLWQSSS
jgi:hypothetical protein